jgi:hypothetical protein
MYFTAEDDAEGDEGDESESVELPVDTGTSTFLPGCCKKISDCTHCGSTMSKLQRPSSNVPNNRPTDADMAAKALHINISRSSVSMCLL